MDPHHSGKLDPDPRRREKQDLNLHQINKVEALGGHFGALEGSSLGKSERLLRENTCGIICSV
jgi:hypothetical protein